MLLIKAKIGMNEWMLSFEDISYKYKKFYKMLLIKAKIGIWQSKSKEIMYYSCYNWKI